MLFLILVNSSCQLITDILQEIRGQARIIICSLNRIKFNQLFAHVLAKTGYQSSTTVAGDNVNPKRVAGRRPCECSW